MRPITTRLIVLAMLTLLSVTTLAAEQTPPYAGLWPGWHAHGPGFWWIFPLMMLLMFVFFAVVFFVLRRDRGGWCPPSWRRGEYPENRYTHHEGDQGAPPETALDILNKRYARGEIEKEEYQEKKATIVSSNT